MAEQIELYHPELDRTIRVSERAARTLRLSGWEDAQEADDAQDHAGTTSTFTDAQGSRYVDGQLVSGQDEATKAENEEDE